jgi:hypothetical protein
VTSLLPHTRLSDFALATGVFAAVVSWIGSVFPILPGSDFFGSAGWLITSLVTALFLTFGTLYGASHLNRAVVLLAAGLLVRAVGGLFYGVDASRPAVALLFVSPLVLGVAAAGAFGTAWFLAGRR